jgi:hypothetical protein
VYSNAATFTGGALLVPVAVLVLLPNAKTATKATAASTVLHPTFNFLRLHTLYDAVTGSPFSRYSYFTSPAPSPVHTHTPTHTLVPIGVPQETPRRLLGGHFLLDNIFSLWVYCFDGMAPELNVQLPAFHCAPSIHDRTEWTTCDSLEMRCWRQKTSAPSLKTRHSCRGAVHGSHSFMLLVSFPNTHTDSLTISLTLPTYHFGLVQCRTATCMMQYSATSRVCGMQCSTA